MGKQRDLTAFERGMIVGARRHGASISKTAEFVKCSRAAVVKVFKDWTVSRKSGSERANCGRQRLVNVRAERRVARLVQDNRRTTVPCQIPRITFHHLVESRGGPTKY